MKKFSVWLENKPNFTTLKGSAEKQSLGNAILDIIANSIPGGDYIKSFFTYLYLKLTDSGKTNIKTRLNHHLEQFEQYGLEFSPLIIDKSLLSILSKEAIVQVYTDLADKLDSLNNYQGLSSNLANDIALSFIRNVIKNVPKEGNLVVPKAYSPAVKA